VRQKYVKLGQIDQDLRVIKSGLGADDRVIVSGLTLMRPGLKVTPQEQGPTPTPTASGSSPSKTD
jgi:multidrug efflux pump subunit AcrA (membrane-fusion protein)